MELPIPDERNPLLATSVIFQARQRLKDTAIECLFAVTVAEWSARSADVDRWRGYALYE